MNKQQTAVDYFEYELTKLDFDEITQENCWFYIIPIYEQAKEMEKEQNLNYLKEYFEWHKSMRFVSHKPEDIIEFNETYGEK